MGTIRDVVTNEQILAIAEGIRGVTRTTEEMTVPEMPERLLQIKVVETKIVPVDFSAASSPVSLGNYSAAVSHLFIVTPKTSEDALLLQKVKPEIELAYDAGTGALSLAFSDSRDVTINFLVADLLLPGDEQSKGFLILQAGSSTLEIYSDAVQYDAGQMFIYRREDSEGVYNTLGVTLVTHDPEEFNLEHNALMATSIDYDALVSKYNALSLDLKSHKENTDNPHSVTKAQVGLGNVDNTSDANKPVSDATLIELEKKVDKVEGKQLSTNDFTNDYKDNVDANTASRHTHANKAVLDEIEQPFKTTQRDKLDSIETGAQVNIIEQINVNGVKQDPDGKVVNIPVPTKNSQLENDADYSTKTEAQGYASDAVSAHNNTSISHTDIRDAVASARALAQDAKNIAEARSSAYSSDTLRSAVTAIDGFDNTRLRAGDAVLILQQGVPDLWVYKVENTYVSYPYTTDEEFLNLLDANSSVQVGYYSLAKSEGDSIDLSDYVKKTTKINGQTLDKDITLDAESVGADPAGAASSAVSTHNAAPDAHSALFNTKVDKVNGKQLSTNDYTNEEKSKLAGIEAGAQVNRPLYTTTGQNTDGAMSQKATSDALSLISQVANDALPKANVKNERDESTLNVYSAKYIQDNFTPKSFVSNLYLTKTGTLSAAITNTAPAQASTNYLELTTTNTEFDFATANKLTLTRVLENKVEFDRQSSIKLVVSCSFSRNASLEFAARISIGGQLVSTEQAFGLYNFNGSAAFDRVTEFTCNIYLDKLTQSTVYEVGQIMTIELFTRQVATQSLTTRLLCGVISGGVVRHSYVSLNLTSVTVGTSQIANGAITTDKLSDGAVTDAKITSVSGTKVSGVVRTTQQVLTKEEKLTARQNIDAVSNADKGTVVKVNNTTQSVIQFSSDPQTQINDKASVDGNYKSLISGGNVVVDTRDVDSPPSYYANQETCYEFKSKVVIGLGNYMPADSYVTLKSVKGWTGEGYIIYQEAISAGNDDNAINASIKCYRYGRNDTWGEWQIVGTKMPYEHTKQLSFGESGYLYIGKFPIYDTNITVDISCTTSTTYSGKLVIACQNYAVLKASVYGDYSNTVTPNIYYKVVDNTVEVYFKPQSWSKNVIHITGCGIRGNVTHVCENISTIPTDATTQPDNAYYSTAVRLTDDQEIAGTKTFVGALIVPDVTI